MVDHAVQALAVVIDDPPQITDIVFPAFEQRLEHIAFVQFRIAHQPDHAARFHIRAHAAMQIRIILHQRRKKRFGNPEADRAGREIDVAAILGPRRIGLRAAETAEIFQLVDVLPAQQMHDRVIDRAGMRFHRDPVFRPQHIHIQRGQQRRRRGAGCLMPTDLQPVPAGPDVVGVMDHPGGEPQDLALDLLQAGELIRRDDRRRSAIDESEVRGRCWRHRPVPFTAEEIRSDYTMRPTVNLSQGCFLFH